MYFDPMPFDEVVKFKPEMHEPIDFDAFWAETLTEVRSFPLNPIFKPVDFGLKAVESYDVTFNGWAGNPIKAWLMLPHDRKKPLPCVVEYNGYGDGRGFPLDWLMWSNVGFANLVMDNRGNGSNWIKPGDTPDPNPEGTNEHKGVMTRGILDPKTYYYRRLYSDCVRAIEAARAFRDIDASRIGVTGHSQGGGLSIAASGLDPTVSVVIPGEPFLCNFERATQITDAYPYRELTNYCQIHRDYVDIVFKTLRYFDTVNLGKRAQGKALFSVGLMDDICPASTVYAAFNHYGGPKEIKPYRFNHHEGGGTFQLIEEIKFAKKSWGQE